MKADELRKALAHEGYKYVHFHHNTQSIHEPLPEFGTNSDDWTAFSHPKNKSTTIALLSHYHNFYPIAAFLVTT